LIQPGLLAGSYAIGSYVDFATTAGFEWWVKQCQEQLLQHGARGLWNDNNEYEVSPAASQQS
jgi:alpha-glucosidase (family GH31 glycosyl hydrolase)